MTHEEGPVHSLEAPFPPDEGKQTQRPLLATTPAAPVQPCGTSTSKREFAQPRVVAEFEELALTKELATSAVGHGWHKLCQFCPDDACG